jgi:hypothetical protein
VLSIVLVSALWASAARVPTQPTRPLECYRFSEAFFGGAAVVELLPDSAPAVFSKLTRSPKAVRAVGSRLAPGAAANYAESIFWYRSAADSVRIVWATRFGSYNLRFAVRGDSLVGTYAYTSDMNVQLIRRGDSSFVVFPEEIRPAHATRVACPGPGT